jgi:hypothetical protein
LGKETNVKDITYEGMYSIVRAALLAWVCANWEPENEDEEENAAAGDVRSKAAAAVATDFMVISLC